MSTVTGFIGYPRAGKTYHMSEIALGLIEKGEEVFSRHEIIGAKPLTEDREMIFLRHAHIMLDEWHMDRDAKHWYMVPKIIGHMTSQAAKYDNKIYWSAQDWFYMPYSIRSITDDCWIHWPVMRDPHTDRSRIHLHKAIRVAGYELEAKHRHPEILESKYFWIRKKVAQKYDSKRAIFIPEDVISEKELQTILSPLARAPVTSIEIKKQTFKQIYFVETEKRKNELAANPFVDGLSDPKPKEDRLDRDHQSKDGIELGHGQKSPHDLLALVKVGHPGKNIRRKSPSRRKKADQKADQGDDKRDEKAGDHI